MINSIMTIGGHLTDRKLCDLKGAPTTLPTLYPSRYQFKLKIIDRGADGKPVQVYPHVTALTSSMGLVYAQPRAGTFKLRYGTGTATAAIDFEESPADFETKLGALADSTTYGLDVVYSPAPSTWVFRFLTPGGPPIPLNGIENELEPETFIRVRQFTQNAETWMEVRLIQGPVASTNDHDTILPPPPTVRTIRNGYTEGDIFETIIVDEIQAIYVPPDFTGTYIVKFQGHQSIPLSGTDGPQNIQDAMNAMWTDGQTRFQVTNPEANTAYVQFVGPFSGMDMDELTILVSATGQPDLFFQIDLFTTEVAEALQRSSSIDAKFEVRLHITDPAVIDDPGQDVILFQEPVTIVRPLHWEGLEEAAPINWLFPPNPKDYIPFTQDQIIVGAVNYSTPFGDGILNDYVIAHDLNSSNLQVSVRQNTLGGLQLTDEEFSVSFDNNNALTIHIVGDPPDTNSLIAVILSSGPVSAFLSHTHTIGQIVGLQEILDNILSRLSALEALLPSIIGLIPGASVFGTDSSASLVDINIDDEWNLVPTNRKPEGKDVDPDKLAPAGILLPAVHSVIDLGEFTADPDTNEITLAVPYGGTPALVDGQRARIYTPQFYEVGLCTFDHTTDTITTFIAHGLANGRRVMFSGGVLPESISTTRSYYVINTATNTFQISVQSGGDVLPLITDGDTAPHTVSTVAEVPGGLQSAVDYFMIDPTSTVFKLSETIGGSEIDITSEQIGSVQISTIDDILNASWNLPGPDNAGKAYSVREPHFLISGRGILSETVDAGDIVASDGRMWYHVTRSDSPGSNSFYPLQMEKEIFRIGINDRMLAAGSVLTVTFSIGLRMYKQNTNIQYLLVVELADVPPTTSPSPTGPNLYEVIWNTTPLLQQRIIVTDTLITHKFGAQVIHAANGVLSTNKKLYGVELAGDIIPTSANFAMRARLIEFDTEDNIIDGTGLIYYKMDKAVATVTTKMPTSPNTTPAVP